MEGLLFFFIVPKDFKNLKLFILNNEKLYTVKMDPFRYQYRYRYYVLSFYIESGHKAFKDLDMTHGSPDQATPDHAFFS